MREHPEHRAREVAVPAVDMIVTAATPQGVVTVTAVASGDGRVGPDRLAADSIEADLVDRQRQADAGVLWIRALDQLRDDVNLTLDLIPTEALDELVASFVENGYFEEEPLVVVPIGEDRFKTVEGNRRLATLKLLLDGIHHLTTLTTDIDRLIGFF